jgi:hypothetical protein
MHFAKGGEAYDAAREFVREHGTLFSFLGDDPDLSFVRQETRIVNKRAAARIMLDARGERGAGRLYFKLQKEGEIWKVVSVSLEEANGRYRSVYPATSGPRKGI